MAHATARWRLSVAISHVRLRYPRSRPPCRRHSTSNVVAPHLEKLYAQLNEGKATGAAAFDPRQAHSPLPRAYQWADGSAYVNHVELVRRSRGATMPAEFWTDPLMYQGGSDGFLGPTDDIVFPDETWVIDF